MVFVVFRSLRGGRDFKVWRGCILFVFYGDGEIGWGGFIDGGGRDFLCFIVFVFVLGEAVVCRDGAW